MLFKQQSFPWFKEVRSFKLDEFFKRFLSNDKGDSNDEYVMLYMFIYENLILLIVKVCQ